MEPVVGNGTPQGPGIDDLAAAIGAARSTVVLTGAGISTESGLPDYRGAAGLWRNRRFEQLASIEAFRRDTAGLWEFYRSRLADLRGARPNAGHEAIAALELARACERVVTQNVDGLHRDAGSDPLEVHGSLHHADCLSCGRRISMDECEAMMAAAPDGVPRCSCGAAFKPGVVLFGEMLAPAIELAARLVDGCDLLVACGTSLEVAPVSWFPLEVLARGGRVAVVNIGPTAIDRVADLRIEAPLGDVLPAVARRVLGTS